MISPKRLSSFLLITLSAILGCAHTPTSGLPPHIKRISIPIFKNTSTRYGLEKELTDQVTQEFILDGRLKVMEKDRAEAELAGEVISYARDDLSYDEDGYVTEYQIRILLKLKLHDLVKDEVIWEDQQEKSTTYLPQVPGKEENNYETEEDALDRLVEDLARAVVVRTTEGW
ncbi:MAG: LptE family protein [bacterium]